MSKKVLTVIFLVAIFVIAVYLYNNKDLGNVQNDSVDESASGEVELQGSESVYFVVQTSFQNPRHSITLDELKELELYSYSEDIDNIKQILGNSASVSELTNADLYSELALDTEKLIVVPFKRADYRLKTLSIDGKYFWDFNWDDYSLSINSGGVAQKDSIKSILFTGEMIAVRDIAKYRPNVDSYDYFFQGTEEAIEGNDLLVSFIENPVFGRPNPQNCGGGCMTFVGDEEFLDSVEKCHFDVISLAANHIGDGGLGALSRTLELLNQKKIAHTGASDINRENAVIPVVKELGDIKVAFLGYDDVAYYYWAGDESWGAASLSNRSSGGVKSIDYERLQSDIDSAKNKSDIVIVMMSWGGREYVNYALDYQRELGHAIIDAGADIVIGTHQHWVNEVEFYNDSTIFYGLGNYIFDQTHTDETRQGIFVRMSFLGDKLLNIKIIPHQTCGYHQLWEGETDCTLYQPQLLEENHPAYKEIWERMLEYSEI